MKKFSLVIMTLALVLTSIEIQPAFGCQMSFPIDLWCSECGEVPCGGRETSSMSQCACILEGQTCSPCQPACDCFLAGTSVKTWFGDKAIEDIRVGDRVINISSEGSLSNGTVTNVYTLWRWQHFVINNSIKATDNQPFWAQSQNIVMTSGELGNLMGFWRTASELKIGDELLGVDGKWTTVTSIERIDAPVRVYGLEVSGTHTFFANSHLVHNKEQCPQF